MGWPLNKFLSELQHPYRIVQIGAHIGRTDNDPLYWFLQRNHHPKDRIILVEPIKEYSRILRENYSNCPSIQVCRTAIVPSLDSKPEVKMYRLRHDKLNQTMGHWLSQLASVKENRHTDLWDHYEANYIGTELAREFLRRNIATETVPACTLREFFWTFKITELDLLVMDTEGLDGEILLQHNWEFLPKAIFYEHVLLHEEEQQSVTQNLEKRGYRLTEYGQNTLAILDAAQQDMARIPLTSG